jgi:DNA-binding response OmpR family regulator
MQMMKAASILIVDDDQRLCDLLKRYLGREGFHVYAVQTGVDMRRHIEQDLPDLVLLDLMLPDADGLALARELRAHPELGIIILTGKGEAVDRIVGLEVGADDYISKPFQNRELLARIRSVLRRLEVAGNHKPVDEPATAALRFSGWTLDLAAHELISPGGEKVHLTTNEFRLLTIFAKSGNRIMNRDRILDLLAEREWHPDDRGIDVLVGKLRKKLDGDAAEHDFIKTIRGEGYKFIPRVESA